MLSHMRRVGTLLLIPIHAAVLAAFLLVVPVTAGETVPLRFAPPIAVNDVPGWFILNYFDLDNGPAWQDWGCGTLSYDGHNGTDFYVPHGLVFSEKGVTVRAAADGIVRGVRDGEPDVDVNERGRAAVKGKEAGNGVAVNHGNGWETQYSHLRRGSILVKPGDKVVTGQPLGLVGLSGSTEFPHVEFSIRRNGTSLCPFTGNGAGDGCGVQRKPLWTTAALSRMPYVPTAVLYSGFMDRPQTLKEAKQGKGDMASLPRDTPAIVFWTLAFGLRKGDRIEQRILTPAGRVLAERSILQERNRILEMWFIGRKVKTAPLGPGEYVGICTVTREGEPVVNLKRILTVR